MGNNNNKVSKVKENEKTSLDLKRCNKIDEEIRNMIYFGHHKPINIYKINFYKEHLVLDFRSDILPSYDATQFGSCFFRVNILEIFIRASDHVYLINLFSNLRIRCKTFRFHFAENETLFDEKIINFLSKFKNNVSLNNMYILNKLTLQQKMNFLAKLAPKPRMNQRKVKVNFSKNNIFEITSNYENEQKFNISNMERYGRGNFSLKTKENFFIFYQKSCQHLTTLIVEVKAKDDVTKYLTGLDNYKNINLEIKGHGFVESSFIIILQNRIKSLKSLRIFMSFEEECNMKSWRSIKNGILATSLGKDINIFDVVKFKVSDIDEEVNVKEKAEKLLLFLQQHNKN